MLVKIARNWRLTSALVKETSQSNFNRNAVFDAKYEKLSSEEEQETSNSAVPIILSKYTNIQTCLSNNHAWLFNRYQATWCPGTGLY